MRPFFGLGRVQARRVGVQRTADGMDVAPTTYVLPRLCVVAMGWTHALHLCQRVLEARADAVPGLDASNRLVDRRRAPSLRPVAHAEYVDNFVAFSQVPGRAGRATLGVEEELRRSSLRAHPVEKSQGGESLGWMLSAEEPIVSAKPRRMWQLRLALGHALSRPTLGGKQVEVLIGHCTHAFLLRKELLACFNAVYAFVREASEGQVKTWPSVRRELHWAKYLLCYCRRDLCLPASEPVMACDASEWGLGAFEARRASVAVAHELRFSEAWRFPPGELAPREAARDRIAAAADEKGERERTAGTVGSVERAACVGRVPVVGADVLGGGWSVVMSSPWRFVESMPLLETRAALWCLRRQMRNLGHHRHRYLVLSDSLSCVLCPRVDLQPQACFAWLVDGPPW